MELKQYDIILVNSDPTIGSEIKKTRPCVIITPNEMNRYLRTVIVAPMTSTSKHYPTRVKVTRTKDSWVVLDQIRTINSKRIIKNQGKLDFNEIRLIKAVIREAFVE